MNTRLSTNLARELEEAVDTAAINQLGFSTRFAARLRCLTPIRIVL